MDPDTFQPMCQWIGGLLGVIVVFLIFLNEKKKEHQKEQQLIDVEMKTASMNKLEEPCQIILIRLSSFAAALSPFTVVLNGSEVGRIKNDGMLKLSTDYGENELVFRTGPEFTKPFHFSAKSGGEVTIQFKAGGKPQIVSTG